MILNLQKKSERFTHLNLNIYLKATAIKTVGVLVEKTDLPFDGTE